jgi:polar amino acid transport system substrate-binding protein
MPVRHARRLVGAAGRSRLSAIGLLFVSALLVLALLAQVPLSGPSHAKEWRTVRIASEGARPPFNYLDANGELAGFEIDLGTELCRRMQVTCTFVTQDWDGMIPNLLAGRYDAIMAAMEKTEDRAKRIDFSHIYVHMPSAFLAARKRQIRESTPKGLAGRTIGVEAGGPHQSYLEDEFSESTVKTYGTLEDAILDLAEGRIDLVFGDKDAIDDFLKTRREAQCCKLLADVPSDPAYFGEGIGIGLRPDDQDLKTLFDTALDATIADGTFAKIRSKYFDFEIL